MWGRGLCFRNMRRLPEWVLEVHESFLPMSSENCSTQFEGLGLGLVLRVKGSELHTRRGSYAYEIHHRTSP